MIDLTDLKTIKKLLAGNNLRPTKTLGQNFLLSKKVIDKISKAAELSRADTVLEIGPGLGVLTFELAKLAKQVMTVEKDPRLVEVLLKNLKTEKLKKVEVVNQDILKFSTNKLLATNYKLVANLPYQITSPVLWKFLFAEKFKPELLVIMIQKEVAERLVAEPGQMSLLSVLVQFYTHPSVVMQAKKTLFYPQPKVDSTVVKLKMKKNVLWTDQSSQLKINEDLFFKLVKTGFWAKRKTLKNNFKALSFSQQIISEAFNKINLSEKSRAQELSITDWLNLYKVLYN